MNSLFFGLAYNMNGYFAHRSYYSSPQWHLEIRRTIRKISARIILKPSPTMYLLK